MMKLWLLVLAGCFPASPGALAIRAGRAPAPRAAPAPTYFTLSLARNSQEIENQYVTNAALYARVLQYLNYDIAQDAFLRLPGQPDSVAAVAASYPRQYGTTGRSSVLLVFAVPGEQLRRGCQLTFRGDKLEVGTRRFSFSAGDVRAARRGQPVVKPSEGPGEVALTLTGRQ